MKGFPAGEGQAAEAAWGPCRSAQQRQHVVGQGVGLRQHRGAGLLQDLRTGQGSRFGSEVGVHDSAAGSGLVLGADLQGLDEKAIDSDSSSN